MHRLMMVSLFSLSLSGSVHAVKIKEIEDGSSSSHQVAVYHGSPQQQVSVPVPPMQGVQSGDTFGQEFARIQAEHARNKVWILEQHKKAGFGPGLTGHESFAEEHARTKAWIGAQHRAAGFGPGNGPQNVQPVIAFVRAISSVHAFPPISGFLENG